MTKPTLDSGQPGKEALHFRLQGRFTMSMAMELTAAMRNACHNQSDMIIHTAELTAIEPGSGKLFEQLLQATGLSLDHVYCTGEKGYQILGNRSHVLVCTTRGRCLCERCMGAALPHQ